MNRRSFISRLLGMVACVPLVGMIGKGQGREKQPIAQQGCIVLSYGDVTLPCVAITRFQQGTVVDESRLTWSGTSYDIQVNGIITTNPSESLEAIQSRLLKPRQKLSVKVGDVELIQQQLQSGTVDTENGPNPVSSVLTEMAPSTFLVNYHVKATYWGNNCTIMV